MKDMKPLFDEIEAILEKSFEGLVVEPKEIRGEVKQVVGVDPTSAKAVFHEEGRKPKELPDRDPRKPYWKKRVSSSRLRDHFLARMRADGKKIKKPKNGGMYLVIDGQPVTHYRTNGQISMMGEGLEDYAKGYLKLYQFHQMYKKTLRGMAVTVFADHNGNSIAIAPFKVIFR